MKKSRILSLLLAAVLMAACVPAVGLATAAVDNTATASYVIYQQDFEDVTYGAEGEALLEELGWYIPASKVETNHASYSIVGNTTNRALQVSTLGAANTADSFVTIFGGEVMSILRQTSFKLSYRLTYSALTTDPDGYAALIYNYNELHGSVANCEGNEVYGIAAVRMCGTGMNAVYYPASGANCDFHSLERQVGSPYVMANRYDDVSSQPSIYALLGGEEDEDDTRAGVAVMADRVLNIEISYNAENGVFVDINGIRVSEMNTTQDYDAQISNAVLWDDFITRNDGAAIALVAQPGVVAQIDDIKVESESINKDADESDMPALLITQVSGCPTGYWNLFLEIYNPTDAPVDVANYSIIQASSAESGYAVDNINANRKAKYSKYIKLADMFGHTMTLASGTASNWDYIAIDTLDTIPESMYTLDVDGSGNMKEFTQISGTTTYEEAAPGEGTYCHILYKDEWNTRYQRGNADYDYNTMLNPGECMVLYLENGKTALQHGINHGQNDTTDIEPDSWRDTVKNYGLSEKTKVLGIQTITIENAELNTYLIGKAVDENNTPIVYTNRYVTDHSDIECYVQYAPPMAIGRIWEGTDPTATSYYGTAGIQEMDFTGSFVYGIDAEDARCGTLYTARTPLKHRTRSHIGALAGYQEILIGAFYKRATTAPELMITEIMPHTVDLEGRDSNAFSAMELTNVSKTNVDLYKYALTRSDLGIYSLTGSGFTRGMPFRAGNPVEKISGNGSYYYFAEDHIKNPEECVLAPGETVVIWFVTGDTYNSYYTDADFDVSYFRQYWVNSGCPELGIKKDNGEYNVKVIAYDGCDDSAYNGDNAAKAFSLSYKESAVYGVANATPTLLAGTYNFEDVISVACFSMTGSYYEHNKTAVETANGTQYINELKCSTIPVNMGMTYVVGTTYCNRISQQKMVAKVNYHLYSGSAPYYSTDPAATLRITNINSNALQQPGLGVLKGDEAYCVRDNFFLKTTAGNKTVYRYYDNARAGVSTLEGAALDANSTTAYLRFDSAVEKSAYASLIATYGAANVKVGTLVMRSSKLKADTKLTKDGLTAAGVDFIDVPAKLLYYSEGYAVLGSTVQVNDKNYSTYYTAVGYMEVKTADGVTHTYWSNSSTERSVESVAKAALKDTMPTETGIYTNQVARAQYSPYSDAQLAQYKIFAGQ